MGASAVADDGALEMVSDLQPYGNNYQSVMYSKHGFCISLSPAVCAAARSNFFLD